MLLRILLSSYRVHYFKHYSRKAYSMEYELVALVKEATKAATIQAITTEQMLRVISDEVIPNQVNLQEQLDKFTEKMAPCSKEESCIHQVKHDYAKELTLFTDTMQQVAVLIAKVSAIISFFKILGVVLGTCTMLAGIYKLLQLYFKGQ